MYKLWNHKQAAAFQHIVVCLRVTGIHISNSSSPVASCSENESCVALGKALLQDWCIVRTAMAWTRNSNLLSSIYSQAFFSSPFGVFSCRVQSLLSFFLFLIPKVSGNVLCWFSKCRFSCFPKKQAYFLNESGRNRPQQMWGLLRTFKSLIS